MALHAILDEGGIGEIQDENAWPILDEDLTPVEVLPATRPTISLQAAIGATAATNLFTLDVSVLDGTDVLGDYFLASQWAWEEIGTYCYTVSTRRGRQRFLEQFKAGTLVAELDNTDRRFDPTWTTGPYAAGGVSHLTTDVAIRLIATWSGVEYPLFYGFVDDWSPDYYYPEGGRSRVTATDAFKLFTGIDPLEQVAVGADEATGARITRILNLAGWDPTQRDLDVGNHTHQATTLAQPIASQLRLAADSERGDLYVSADGKVTFRERLARELRARSRFVQWVFGDGVGELNPSGFAPTNNDELKKNDVRVARVGGTQVVRQNAEAVAYPYKRRTYNRTDLTLADDAQVAEYADWVLNLFGVQQPRIDYMEWEPDGYLDLWPMVLGAQFADRVTCIVTHSYDNSRWSGAYFVEGVDHDIPVMESGGRWRTKTYLADASQFPTNPFILDSSVLDGIDVLL